MEFDSSPDMLNASQESATHLRIDGKVKTAKHVASRCGIAGFFLRSIHMAFFVCSLTWLIGCGGTSHSDFAQQVKDLGGTMHVHVEFGGTEITDDDLATLDFPDTVRSVSLCDTSISDAGAQELARGHNIEQIDLTNTKITDRALENLRQMPRLCMVNVASPEVSPQAFGKIRFFLSDRMLKIQERSPILALPRLPAGTHDVFTEDIPEAARVTTVEPLPPGESLRGYDLAVAKHDGELQIHLDFQNSHITDDDLANMPLPENIRSISLRGTAITDQGVNELLRAGNIEIVDLQNTAVTDAAIPVLLRLPRLWKALVSTTNISTMAQKQLVKTLSQKRGSIEYDYSRVVNRPSTVPVP